MPRRWPAVVLAPDSFKGSLSASTAAAAIAEGLRRVWPDADLRLCPMADGGEGTLDAALSRGGQRLTDRISDISGKPQAVAYGLLGEPATAVLEVAQVVGLTDPAVAAIDVEHRTSLGVGKMIRNRLDAGVRSFMIGLGGSSTNDGGAGMLAALGLSLSDARGRAIEPTPAGLAALAAVDASGLDPRLADARIIVMSDVNNPLTGERGATAIFGPQKGVRRERIAELDGRVANFASLTERALDRRAQEKPGAGAAGGLGFALQLIGGEMRSGAEVVADLIGLDAALDGSDWAITGEGKSDAQTALGKTPLIVAKRAAARQIPATLISGSIDRSALPELGRHFAGCFSLPSGPASLEQCLDDAAALLADRAEQVARLFDAARRR
ncbi:MAG TPA: glycerate kinase [Casimicrobiaceae bacterium]|jgi:glycerate kinase|nr:glycerate kinase [Casimicrobiaceae bacterium]